MSTAPQLIDLQPKRIDVRDEVLAGLSRTPRMLPPKLFYDEEGSRLFEEITRLPEYYPTRTEIAILESHATEMAEGIPPGSLLVELGSGSSRKTRLLLDALAGRITYMPVDISIEMLENAAAAIQCDYPDLEVRAVCADYGLDFAIPDAARYVRRIVFFPGSTIGNFARAEALVFLGSIARALLPGDAIIIGADLRKDPAVLEAAYDDAAGITAEFNLNMLRRINRELGADFDLAAWRHVARYNATRGRIEMYLVSTRDQIVTVSGERFEFERDDEILTEISCKYTIDEFRAILEESGFSPSDVWTDPDSRFSVHRGVVPADTKAAGERR